MNWRWRQRVTNGGYIVAAYGLTAIVLVGYLLSLWRRLTQARADLEAPDAE